MKEFPYAINVTAPENPNIIPPNFVNVIFSLIKIADIINTKRGVKVTITAPLMGVDKLRPLMNASMFTHIPKTEAIKSLG